MMMKHSLVWILVLQQLSISCFLFSESSEKPLFPVAAAAAAASKTNNKNNNNRQVSNGGSVQQKQNDNQEGAKPNDNNNDDFFYNSEKEEEDDEYEKDEEEDKQEMDNFELNNVAQDESTNTLWTRRDIVDLESVDEVDQILLQQHDEESSSSTSGRMLFVAVVSSTCVVCQPFVDIFQDAVPMIQNYFFNQQEDEQDSPKNIFQPKHDPPPPIFATLDITSTIGTTKQWLQVVRVTAVPVIKIFYTPPSSALFDPNPINKDIKYQIGMLDFAGPHDSARDIYGTVLHTWYRYIYLPEMSSFRSKSQLQTFLKQHGPGLFQRPDRPALNVEYTQEERDDIQWLLYGNAKSDASYAKMQKEDQEIIPLDEPDPFVVMVQCRQQENRNDSIASTQAEDFDYLAKSLRTFRDVVFLTIEPSEDDSDSECPPELLASDKEEGDDDDDSLANTSSIGSYLVFKHNQHSNTTIDETFLSLNQFKSFQDYPNLTLSEFLVVQSTPSILFYDKASTAPIAFDRHRQVHAVLFVQIAVSGRGGGSDNNNNNDKPQMTNPFQKHTPSFDAIRSFYKACQRHRFSSSRQPGMEMVCLVVPQTETRLLRTFGIDIWTPLDKQLTRKETTTTETDLLPVLMITDQRNEKPLHRYYLDSIGIVSNDDESSPIETFVQKFWNQQLEPVVESDSRPLRVNSFGVEIINAKNFPDVVLGRPRKHSLLYVYTPTCGHCQRFFVMWNQLAELVREVQWDVFLDVLQMDISENEVNLRGDDGEDIVVDPAFVPAVYYFAAANDADDTTNRKRKQPIQYNIRDRFGDGAGRLTDPLEIIDWLLTLADDLDEAELLRNLEKLEAKQQQKEEKQDDEVKEKKSDLKTRWGMMPRGKQTKTSG